MFCIRCGTPLASRELHGVTRQACTREGCGYIHYENPLPVVAAVVEHEGKVLLVRNKGWPEKWFGLVTGFLEKAELPEVAILRELEEELGLKGTVRSLIGAYTERAHRGLRRPRHRDRDAR
jgi:NADH pyrophosphatase NudC (nudix superfamily)